MNLTDIAGFGKSLGFTIFNATRTNDHSGVIANVEAGLRPGVTMTAAIPGGLILAQFSPGSRRRH